jgi:hypothetical protein
MPVKLSVQAMSISAMPQFFISVKLLSKNFAPSFSICIGTLQNNITEI